MNIAITSQDDSMGALVEPRFGRSPGFILIDSETNSHTYFPNEQNMQAAQGAGIQTAQNIATQNVQIVITGNCGPKAFKALQAAGIQIALGASGTVQETYERWKRGELEYAASPNAASHGGM